MTLNQPTTIELADFVHHEGAKKAGQLLGVSESAVCRKLNRAGIWMRGRKNVKPNTQGPPMTNHSLPNQVISSVKCNHCHEVILAFRGTATFDLAQIVRDHAVKENCRPHYGRIAESIRNFSNHVDRLEQAEGVR